MNEDFDIIVLHAELIMFLSVIPSISNISDITYKLGHEYLTVNNSLFFEVTKLLKLTLTISVSAGTAKCFFVILRRLNTLAIVAILTLHTYDDGNHYDFITDYFHECETYLLYEHIHKRVSVDKEGTPCLKMFI